MNAFASIAEGIEALAQEGLAVEGLVATSGYDPIGRPLGEALLMEAATAYGADAVFFEAGRAGREGTAQALVYVDDHADDETFAALHRRLWSWGAVPLVYRRTRGLIQLFRLSHRPDFLAEEGRLVCKPVRSLRIAAAIASADAWWSADRLRNGTLWDDPKAEKLLLSKDKAAHRTLFGEIRTIYGAIQKSEVLTPDLSRRLLILSLLIAYLAERRALPDALSTTATDSITAVAEVFKSGEALVGALEKLEGKFNGGVFELSETEKALLKATRDLPHFRRLIEAREDSSGQIGFWQRYSFRDLPVELISEIYQLFVRKAKSSVYTPPALVRMLLDEVLDERRLDRLLATGECILDPACGSGVFLVEAYKKLIARWRSLNGWIKPSPETLRELLGLIRGVDFERGAVDLAAFSLCLAMCEALEPDDIAASEKLFPKLLDTSLINSCFFDARREAKIDRPIGVIVGNPPFASELNTNGALKSAAAFEREHFTLPDKQVAYLFLHEAMEMLEPGGVLCMLQGYNLLYNRGARAFRNLFLSRWDVREVLDFVSIRGLFDVADTKALAIVAEAAPPLEQRRILHAVFRRTARASAELSFEVDHYDLHWISRSDVIKDRASTIWRSALLGGARLRSVVERLGKMPTLQDFADANGLAYGEGFQEGRTDPKPAEHVNGKRVLNYEGLLPTGIEERHIGTMGDEPIQWPRDPAIFTPPMLLVHEQMDLNHAVWDGHYLTYRAQIVGFAGKDVRPLQEVASFLDANLGALRGYVATNSARLFTQKATAISCADVYGIPLPPDRNLDLSANEKIVLSDVVEFYGSFVRMGVQSDANVEVDATTDLKDYCDLICGQVNAFYCERPLVPLAPYEWPGIICQPFAFGEAGIDWSDAEELRGRVDSLLRDQRQPSLSMTRIARIYDGSFMFLVKPNRARYWLKSIALRDADDLLADLRIQGF